MALLLLGCTEEVDYPEQAKAFYAKYAKSAEIARLFRYGIKLRNTTLYVQECQHTPDDSIKTWAIYENYPRDHAEAKIDLANLKIALTPFEDFRTGRVVPEYETADTVDTTGAKGEEILRVRAAIRAFSRLKMEEVICGGQGVVYLVQKNFMLIHVAAPASVPDGIKNVATQLDENWYYEISFALQDEQRRRLIPFLREFWNSLQSQKAQQQSNEKQ